MAAEEQVRQSLRRKSRGGRIACKTLLELAARMKVSPRKLGRMCDEMGIRIRACQLGCFR